MRGVPHRSQLSIKQLPATGAADVDAHVTRLRDKVRARARFATVLCRAAGDDPDITDHLDPLPRVRNRVVSLRARSQIPEKLGLRPNRSAWENAAKIVGVNATDDGRIPREQGMKAKTVSARHGTFGHRPRRSLPLDALRVKFACAHCADSGENPKRNSHDPVDVRVCPL